ncbi:putative transcription factor Rap1 [Aspergillus affinis]|uniref:putative transcription factor Rap1 n=1 Tax=Aspergillus affinis TaxID=1070780 RepID=UPI0022FE066B|nr:uncharacterized protein KD926_004118 [Aspergillus affinis]KAI9046280.1 hypothetical protein KD926_004118 [Aspergillus affinis]
MAETDVEGVKGSSSTASNLLFQGKQFWLSKNIPQRSRFKDSIERNGGLVRLFEKDAEIKLVDHMKRHLRNIPANAFSYRFVEDSIRQGRLQKLEDYRCASSAPRPVGATNLPSRGHKILYTVQDDQELWDWVQTYEGDPSASIKGNKIYQEKRKRTPTSDNSDGTDSDGGDIPARKRRATGSPGSNTKTPTPDVPQQSEETSSRQKHAPPPKFILPALDESITKKRSNEMGKGPKKIHERQPEPGPEPEPEPEPEREPELEREPESERKSERELEKAPKPAPEQEQLLSYLNSIQDALGPQEPEPIDVDAGLLELPFLPSTPESSEPDEQPEQDVDAWIDDHLRTGIAKTEDQIIEALRCTSMDPQLADQVLKHLVAGKDIPKDMPGVWTAEDDKCIQGGDTRDIKRVLEKHGSEFLNSRWHYLAMARTAGLEMG